MGLQGHRRENHQLPRALGSIHGHVPHPQIRGSPSAYRLIDSCFGSVRLLDPGFRGQKPERHLDISPLPCSAKAPKATCHKAMFALPYQNPRSNPQIPKNCLTKLRWAGGGTLGGNLPQAAGRYLLMAGSRDSQGLKSSPSRLRICGNLAK